MPDATGIGLVLGGTLGSCAFTEDPFIPDALPILCGDPPLPGSCPSPGIITVFLSTGRLLEVFVVFVSPTAERDGFGAIFGGTVSLVNKNFLSLDLLP